jgi:hypothetical protein
MRTKSEGDIQLPRRLIHGKYTDSQLASGFAPGMGLSRFHESLANAETSMWRQNGKIRDESVLAGRIVELFVRHSCLDGDEADDVAGYFGDEDHSGVHGTPCLQLLKVRLCDLRAGSQPRIQGSFELLQHDDAG